MKARVIIPLILCVVMTIGSAGAAWGSMLPVAVPAAIPGGEAYNQLLRLDEIAAALYDAANDNNRQAGYIQLQKLFRLIDRDAQSSYGSEAGWSIIREDAALIEHALEKGVAGSGWLYLAARIRLAVDAAVHQERALWLQYESLLLDDVVRVKQAWKRQSGDNPAAARAMMHSLIAHVERIEPASRMSGSLARAQQLKERAVYTDKLLEAYRDTGEGNAAEIDASIRALEHAVLTLFQDAEGAQSVPAIASPATSNPIGWALFLGAVISAVLAYSGWRKYKQNPFDIKPRITD